VNDYVCWSAPVDDLTDWRYEGIIFKKKQDPTNPLGIRSLYAPDVVQGTDGKFYLYYAFDFMGQIGVAVCDTPAGRYEYYGKVKFADGHVFGTKSGEPFPFDPGVLVDDDGRVYLYSGFATKVPFVASRWHNLNNEAGVVLELAQDMLTIKMGPKALFPTKGRAGAFKEHAFFEASSIRKVDGRYCFVYSSENNHELCYAMGDAPAGPFTYGGTLVDVGDLYLNGNTDELHAANYLGNTHGGMCCIHGQWYIFYHRQTNRNSYARQACAERLERTADGGFKQAEVTSCGLNGGPLKGIGTYEARIACNLWAKEGTYRYDAPDRKKVLKTHPYFTQSKPDREKDGDQYIANMRDGAVAGFKYFDFQGTNQIEIQVRGVAEGNMVVSTASDFSEIVGRVAVKLNGAAQTFCAPIEKIEGIKPLFFRYEGSGAVDFIKFTMER
jgi:hypothetical protein